MAANTFVPIFAACFRQSSDTRRQDTGRGEVSTSPCCLRSQFLNPSQHSSRPENLRWHPTSSSAQADRLEANTADLQVGQQEGKQNNENLVILQFLRDNTETVGGHVFFVSVAGPIIPHRAHHPPLHSRQRNTIPLPPADKDHRQRTEIVPPGIEYTENLETGALPYLLSPNFLTFKNPDLRTGTTFHTESKALSAYIFVYGPLVLYRSSKTSCSHTNIKFTCTTLSTH